MKKKNRMTKLLLALLLTPALLNAHFVFAEEGTDTQQEQTAIDETLMADEEKISETPLNTTEENILETTPSGSAEQLLEPEANLSDSENTFTENSAADETNAEVTVIISLEDQRSGTTQNISFSGSVNTTQVFSLPVTVAADDIVTSSSDMAVPITDASGQLSVQVTFPASATGIHSLSIVISKPVTITFGSVNIKHLDDFGNLLTQFDLFVAGFVGDSYNTMPITVPGYFLTATPENATGTITATPQTVIYQYDRVQTTVNIVCVDENGTTLGTPVSQPGKFNDSFTIDAPVIAGYEFLGFSLSAKQTTATSIEGIYGLEDQYFTATYRKITSTTDPSEGITTTVPGTLPVVKTTQTSSRKKDNASSPSVIQVTTNKQMNTLLPPLIQKKSYTQAQLPKTGERKMSNSLTVIGFGLLGVVYFTKKKRENEFTI
ncbi:MucBP domain-containing protein [Enterococcus sp. AZ192]|uniref:MucBP domain-containing protein n=1 Tax=unclassified Enterococcus TaxID=2608891 RepID=UPI003D2AB2D1